ncbi:MAG: hypothetical protein LC104_08890 [Bacteroidales bacterium]|nr:hypothetical protein [Bacteroidales bacterium]
MNRIMLAAVAALLGLSVGNAHADFGGPLPTQQPAPEPNYAQEAEIGYETGLYGTHPFLRRLMFWKKDGKPVKEHKAHFVRPLPPPNTALPGSPGVGMPGTLAFPYNPYTRSPRDYFMYDPYGRK